MHDEFDLDEEKFDKNPAEDDWSEEGDDEDDTEDAPDLGDDEDEF